MVGQGAAGGGVRPRRVHQPYPVEGLNEGSTAGEKVQASRGAGPLAAQPLSGERPGGGTGSVCDISRLPPMIVSLLPNLCSHIT